MIRDHEILKLPDLRKKSHFEAEVNWDPENEATNNCQVVRLKCGHGDSYIKRDDFLSFLWLIGQPSDHLKMVPQKITRVRHYETVLGVRATKNIKKGEMVNFPVSFPLPAIEEEIIGDVKKWAKSPSKII